MPDEKSPFCAVENYGILIPYSDFIKIAEMAKNFELIEARCKHMEEMYTGIYGMFSECLDKIREIREFVADT